MQMPGSFNANQFEPKQEAGGHPPALKIPFTITNTGIVENSSKDGGFFQVTLTSQLGDQISRYNIWNKSPKAVEIAHGQLSALCRAVGIYNIDWSNEGAALRGGKGLMDIGYQKGEEPTAEKPQGGYTELKKVYDNAGNEPGKAMQQQQQPNPGFQQQPQAQQAQPGPQSQPLQQQPGGGWGNPPQTAPANQQPPQGWQQAPQQQPNPAAPQNQPGQAWQPGQAPQGQTPPWGQR